MAGAPDSLEAEVEKLLRGEFEGGVAEAEAAAEAAAKTRAPTEAERPAAYEAGAVGRRGTRSCFDADRRPRLTADMVQFLFLVLVLGEARCSN